MERTQSFATHRRWFPMHHFVVMPLLGINLGIAVRRVMHTPTYGNWWTVVMAVVFMLIANNARVMALTVQNRVIRLEQWIRLGAVLPADLKPRVSELDLGQLLGLRFASDAELPELVRRCLAGELRKPDDVKRQVKDWQPDFLRA
ncbi:MAG TPA: DUF6526 family protein [Gemmatimonadaceae bacterium]|nr:DUF6526 family protein [Gemmatimonadaceae bacterium]